MRGHRSCAFRSDSGMSSILISRADGSHSGAGSSVKGRLGASVSCFDAKHNRRGDNEEQPLSEVICLRAFVDQMASFFGSATRNTRGVLLNPDPAGAESSKRVSATFVLSR